VAFMLKLATRIPRAASAMAHQLRATFIDLRCYLGEGQLIDRERCAEDLEGQLIDRER